jgi:two-component system response regulator HydG
MPQPKPAASQSRASCSGSAADAGSAVSRAGAPGSTHTSSEVLKVLWIDDEPDEALGRLLEDYCYQIEWATSGTAGLEQVRARGHRLIVVDARLGDTWGLHLLERLKAEGVQAPALIVTAYYFQQELPRDALRLGAAAVAYKPFFDAQELANAFSAIIEGNPARSPLLLTAVSMNSSRRAQTCRLDDDAIDSPPFGIVAVSVAMRELLGWIHRIAATNAAVLLTGETGTGKELVARAIHAASLRRDQRFVPLNCGAIPEGLFESELFGHRKGAFTGALEHKVGLAHAANGGTLFLDEVGEMSLLLQVRLLRFLDDGLVRRVGDTIEQPVDVRVIAATHRPLDEDVARGRFRKDLYYRLAVADRHIPPLRERVEDLDALIDYWLPRLGRRHDRAQTALSPGARAILRAHHWPGNVRELRNVLERVLALASADALGELDVTMALSHACGLPAGGPPAGPGPGESGQVLAALEASHWNRTEAARRLGVGRTTLWRWLQKMGLGNRDGGE